MTGDSTKGEGKDGDQVFQALVPKGKKKKDDKDEIQIEITAKLGGIGVTVTSVEGDLSHIIVGGESLAQQTCGMKLFFAQHKFIIFVFF